MSSEVDRKAKKSSTSSSTKQQRTYDTQFVRYELDESTKKHLKAQSVAPVKLLEMLSELVSSGHKVSVAEENEGSTVGCYVTAPHNDHPNHGLCLTSRGPDLESAFKSLFYKHFEAFGGNWPRERGERSEFDAWG